MIDPLRHLTYDSPQEYLGIWILPPVQGLLSESDVNVHISKVAKLGARVTGVAAGIALSGILTASPAWSAGSGYTGTPTGTTPASGGLVAPAGFTTILTTQTVPTTGGTVTASGGGATINVVVPTGDVTAPIQVVVTEGTTSALVGIPSGNTATLAYGISFVQNGQKYLGTFSPPVTVTISNSAITTANQVVIWNAASSAFLPVSQSPNVTNVVVGAGTVSFSITSDPYTAILTSSSSTAIAGATSVTTGSPWLTELGAGILLLAIGSILALRLRRTPA